MSLLDLAIEYAWLSNGETHRDKCPFCKANEKSFVITRVNGGLLYNCFRVSCNQSGFVPTRGEYKANNPKLWTPNPYTKPYTRNFPLDISLYLQNKYYLNSIPSYWKWNSDDNELIMGLYDKVSTLWGYQAKKLWPKQDQEKVETYANINFKPRMHFTFYDNNTTAKYFVVEDPISAERIKQNGYRAIALLGTIFNDVKVVHLHNIGIKNLVFCLDKDAWAKVIEFKRKYKSIFSSIQIRVWDSGLDVKEMTQAEFNEVIK